MTKTLLLAALLTSGAGLSLIASQAYAQDAELHLNQDGMHAGHHHHHHDHSGHDHSAVPSAPLGIMGDHLHSKGD